MSDDEHNDVDDTATPSEEHDGVGGRPSVSEPPDTGWSSPPAPAGAKGGDDEGPAAVVLGPEEGSSESAVAPAPGRRDAGRRRGGAGRRTVGRGWGAARRAAVAAHPHAAVAAVGWSGCIADPAGHAPGARGRGRAGCGGCAAATAAARARSGTAASCSRCDAGPAAGRRRAGDAAWRSRAGWCCGRGGRCGAGACGLRAPFRGRVDLRPWQVFRGLRPWRVLRCRAVP